MPRALSTLPISTISLLLTILSLTACGSDSTAPSSATTVQFVNAYAATGTLDFSVDGSVMSSLPFASSSSCFRTQAKSVNFNVTPTGSTTSLGGLPFSTTLAERRHYTVLTVANGFAVYPDSLTTRPKNGRAFVRLSHLWFNTDFPVLATTPYTFLDVYIGASGAPLTTPVVTDLQFLSSSDFLDVAAGLTQITFTKTGTKSPIVGIFTGSIGSGQTVTAVLSNVIGGTGSKVFTVPGCQ